VRGTRRRSIDVVRPRNRNGNGASIPIVESRAVTPAPAAGDYTVDLPLAGFAPGDYTIEVKAVSGGREASERTPIRVTF